MARDFYAEGYATGQASASAWAKQVRATGGGPALALFCGSKIQDIKKRSDLWYVRHGESWPIGFFAGFMDRAERILSGDAN